MYIVRTLTYIQRVNSIMNLTLRIVYALLGSNVYVYYVWYVYVVESMNNYPHDWRLQTRPSFSLRRDLSLLIIVLFISLDLSILYSTMLNRSDYTKQSVGDSSSDS